MPYDNVATRLPIGYIFPATSIICSFFCSVFPTLYLSRGSRCERKTVCTASRAPWARMCASIESVMNDERHHLRRRSRGGGIERSFSEASKFERAHFIDGSMSTVAINLIYGPAFAIRVKTGQYLKRLYCMLPTFEIKRMNSTPAS